jgi:PhnB protein
MAKKAKQRPAKAKKSRRRAKKRVSAIPPGSHTVTPYLVVNDAVAAIDFYVRAFGAKAGYKMVAPDGKIGHAELKIGDSQIFLADEFPGSDSKAPIPDGAPPVSLHLYFSDVDKAFARAIAAGATSTMPLTNMFWGDRFGKIRDPFGHLWSLSQHVEDVSAKEMNKRAAAAFAPPPAA